MIPRLLAALVVGLIALGATVQALLLGRLLLVTVLADLAPAWPILFARAIRVVLWPVARMSGQSPDDPTMIGILTAMLLYLIVMIGGIVVASMIARTDRARHPWRQPPIERE